MAKHALSKSSIDTSLGGDSVRSRREELRNTGSVEAGFRQAEGRTQTGTTSADDDGIVLVVLMAISPCDPDSSIDQPWKLTMTGYFEEMGPSAAFARSGWLPNIRACGS